MSMPVATGAAALPAEPPFPVPSIAAIGVDKRFGATVALGGTGLAVAPGEAVALMGANGAGKSTLVKILSGALQPDAGRIEIAGRAAVLPSPHAARAAGIATVHQATAEAGAPGLTVADNLLLDDICGGRHPLFTGRRAIRRRAAEVAALIGLHLPLERDFAELRPAERQLVAIARAAAARAAVLILDEPTSSLSEAEAARLFAIIDRLKAGGIAILYISHRLGDLARIADRAVVLRGGRIVGEFPRPIDFPAAVGAMIGRPLEAAVPAGRAAAGPPLLSLAGVRLTADARPFDLAVAPGEVVALTGALGSGKSRLLGALFGLGRLAGGSVRLGDREWAPRSPAEAIAAGVFMVAEDRWRSSLIPAPLPGSTIAATIALPHLPRWFPSGLLRPARERRAAAEAIARLGIRARGPDDTLDQLSGGNQQKVVLARWQAEPCRLLLLDEPFQGVDVGARADLIAAIRAAGAATLIATGDAEEALEVADRILVMRDRTIAGSHSGREGSLVAAIGSVETEAAEVRP